jgi:hypothetical protein
MRRVRPSCKRCDQPRVKNWGYCKIHLREYWREQNEIQKRREIPFMGDPFVQYLIGA